MKIIFLLIIALKFCIFMHYIKALDRIKKVLGIFWILILDLLLYGMLFISASGFIVLFKEGFYIIICVLLLGIASVIVERWYKNISLTYFLLCYFALPILYAISFNRSLLLGEVAINSLSQLIFYFGFYLYMILSIIGFVSWIVKKYTIFKTCFITCISFYFPFLSLVAIIFSWIDK